MGRRGWKRGGREEGVEMRGWSDVVVKEGVKEKKWKEGGGVN